VGPPGPEDRGGNRAHEVDVRIGSSGRCACGRLATIVGTDGDDSLIGTDGDDVAWLGPGNDTFAGGAGNDTVCGGPGDDTIGGNTGVDAVFGEDGDDRLDGGHLGTFESDLVDGGSGNDTISGESGTYVGGPGADTYLSPEEGGQELTVRLGSGPDRAVIDNLFLATFWGDEGRDVFRIRSWVPTRTAPSPMPRVASAATGSRSPAVTTRFRCW
jgi:Ca2+-binding RTX toxin-like protein